MVAAYSYMALVPIVQPPVIKLLTTQKLSLIHISGSALAGFVKKTLPGVVCASVETPEQLNAALTAWKEEL